MSPEQIIAHFGTQNATANALGVKQPSVSHWLVTGVVPDVRQWQVELGTEGKLKADRRPINLSV